MSRQLKKGRFFVLLLIIFWPILSEVLSAETRGVISGERYDRLVIRGPILIDGNATSARGPVDVIIEGNRIASVRPSRQREEDYAKENHLIDARGMYLLPGLINLHAHLHDERAGWPMPFEYSYKLWLACGITTIRDVGSNAKKALEERQKSQDGSIVAPRIFLYLVAGGRTPEEIKKRIQELKKIGADGLKLFGLDRDIMKAACEEAHKLGLRVAQHIGVEEINAWDAVEFGITSIEHWYGIPDAALKGSQNFPPDYNYNDEAYRFRYAGRLWREADPEKLDHLLSAMVEKGVAWCPTFAIYEANRDLIRAMNQPWFREVLHPALEEYFKPNPAHHGSYFWDWTTTDEIFWKENFKLWMDAVRRFALKGGLVGVGEDAGFIYQIYGFTLLRELELHQEAGFHPLDVIQHATLNNARILGMEDRLGRIRPGWLADLILVDENPLANFKYLLPTGFMGRKEGQIVQRGGVKWTIKDGLVYDAQKFYKDVCQLVDEARKKKTSS